MSVTSEESPGVLYHRHRRRLSTARRSADVLLPVVLVASGVTASAAARAAPGGWWLTELTVAVVVTELACLAHRIVFDWLVDVRLDRRASRISPSGAGFLVASALRWVTGAALLVSLGALVIGLARFTAWWPAAIWLLAGTATGLIGLAWQSPLSQLGQPIEPVTDAAALAVVVELTATAGLGSVPVLMTPCCGSPMQESAHISGVGRRRRVVVSADVVAGEPEALRAVLAHELAHWRCRHRWWAAVMALAELAVVLVLLRLLAGESLADPTTFPLWASVASVLATTASLGGAWLSRAQELVADQMGARLVGSADLAARVLAGQSQKLGVEPSPPRWAQLWSPYPPLARRLQLLELAQAGLEHDRRPRST